MQPWIKALRNLAWLTQLGLSVAAPPVLCIAGACWLRNRFSLGGWIVAAGVLLGVGGAVSGLWTSLKKMQRQAGEEDPKPPSSFNDHR